MGPARYDRRNETTHEVENAWVLGHQYLRIHEVSRDKNADGSPAYEAIVFVGWDQLTSRYFAIWLDVWGGFSKSAARVIPHYLPA